MKKFLGKWPQLTLDHLPVGLLVIDQEGQVQVFNRTLSRLAGLEYEEVLGRPLQDFLDGSRTGFSKLLQTLSTGKEFQDLKPKAVLPVIDSNGYWVNTYKITDESGTIIGAMAVFIPIERRQELENAIIKAEKLAILGQLAAVAVHEIRNPLTTINGFLQLLQKDLRGTPKEEYLNIMLSELKHVNRLISEILHLARPGYSKRTHCLINKLIREVYILVESEASIHYLEIILDMSNNIPPILADDEQLKQVFLNIIRNAFEALSPGGKLYLQTSCDKDEGFVRITIRDTGTGMDKQTIANMFDPFFTTKETGTGLGMFISKKIIDNHGGRLEVQSEPAKGTTVIVFLPVSD